MGRPPRITRDDVLESARRVFAEQGFDRATLADIAKPLGVTAAAVLRHFSSKQALFAAAMTSGFTAPPPFIVALAGVDAAEEDPRLVLRALAEQFIPFAERIIGATVAVYMQSRSPQFVIPFDRDDPNSPPRRGLVLVADYFRRAIEAGRIRAADPRAAALLFMGSLHSYVTLHHLVKISPKPYPLPAWIDALIDLWTEGAIVGGKRGRNPRNRDQARGVGAARPERARGRAAVRAEGKTAAGDRPVRNSGGKDGERRLARRRPRVPRPGR
jgi:AcrR family transcriptional regulator